MGTAKVLNEKTKEFASAMEAALSEKNTQLCAVAGCVGSAMANTGYCMYHWKQILAEREKHDAKQRKLREKLDKDPKEIEKRRRQVYFVANRCCEKCGRFCSFDTGRARRKKTALKNPGSFDQIFETICSHCEKEETK